MQRICALIGVMISLGVYGQKIRGTVKTLEGDVLPYATILVKGTNIGIAANENGKFNLDELPLGKLILEASFNGYITQKKTVYTDKDGVNELQFVLTEQEELLNQVTVTGTRTDKRQTQNPVIVGVINSETLTNVQACNLSEGLRFQTGLRVETDCQTCNYTQLRMNGLSGGYSQILINGRPVFSPLTGLYGLEQIPTNMIERIEVVRGGGSALYGSSAIGGTVNVLTKIPKKNSYSIGYTYQNINGTSDNIMSGNGTLVNEGKNSGVSFFINNRNRDWYDHNQDNFSELPKLKNSAFGTSLFFLPNENQKIEVNFSKMDEYRYGGEMVDSKPHFALQSEERVHDVYVGNLDYQINFNNERTSLIAYAATQHTNREHYTGIRPDIGTIEDQRHLLSPPYGSSKTTTLQGGIQLNHKVENFMKGDAVFTLGGEFVEDDVFDKIESYQYKVDQLTRNLGVFFQTDWEFSKQWNLLAGFRFDNHRLESLDRRGKEKQLVNNVVSPRVSILFKPFQKVQIRATWGTGFRAPQAFDTDLHIAFAGGGISRVVLADDLKRERSNSYSISFNYDKPTEHYIYGFTLESFYTRLKDAFYLEGIGEDEYGEIFEKRNGDGALVQGITLEARFNYDGLWQFEGGMTFQNSYYNTPVTNSDELPPMKEFLRTPSTYGYTKLTYIPNDKIKFTLNGVYTGKMNVLHLASNENLTQDEYFKSPDFFNFGLNASYKVPITKLSTAMEFTVGVKNIFNAYQNNFDVGKNRDSNFIFGPATPRTYVFGVKLTSD